MVLKKLMIGTKKMKKPQENTNTNKPTLAIISSYDNLCGNASYTRALKHNLEQHFHVDVFSLDITHLDKNMGDRRIKEIAKQLQKYDLVNIQFEAMLYGNNDND